MAQKRLFEGGRIGVESAQMKRGILGIALNQNRIDRADFLGVWIERIQERNDVLLMRNRNIEAAQIGGVFDN